MPENKPHFYACQFCGHSIWVEDPLANVYVCGRCGHKNQPRKLRSSEMTLVFSLTALIFYIPANLYPFMTIELYGHRNSSTIWGGIVSLAEGGSVAIALIVFLASVLIPFLKLIILFYLALSDKNFQRSKFKTRLYHIVESIGRWSMLDIFLLAVLVAIMKLGPWTTVEPEPGALLFAFVVVFTMLASAYFDPQILWKEENGKSN